MLKGERIELNRNMLKKIIALGLVGLFLAVSFAVAEDNIGPYNPIADVNRDGTVDILDLVEVGQAYGSNLTLSSEPNKTVVTVLSFDKEPPEVEKARVAIIDPDVFWDVVEVKYSNSSGIATFELSSNKNYTAIAWSGSASHNSIDGNVTSLEGVNYVYITTKPNNQQGILYMVNVTAFYGSTKIASGISNMSGIVTLTNVPIGNITFVAYAKFDYSQTIANTTVDITTEGQSFDLICDQNYSDVSINWEIIVATLSLSVLMIALPILMFSTNIRIKKYANQKGNPRPP